MTPLLKELRIMTKRIRISPRSSIVGLLLICVGFYQYLTTSQCVEAMEKVVIGIGFLLTADAK